MAEVQKSSVESGELIQRFIEFVMMHAQQAAFAMGQIPHPQTGQPEVNLEVARLFIDQLVMIRAKTIGNLNDDEQKVLNGAISQLQMVFVEVSSHAGEPGGAIEKPEPTTTGEPFDADTPAENSPTPESPAEGEPESRKRFTKSYGS